MWFLMQKSSKNRKITLSYFQFWGKGGDPVPVGGRVARAHRHPQHCLPLRSHRLRRRPEVEWTGPEGGQDIGGFPGKWQPCFQFSRNMATLLPGFPDLEAAAYCRMHYWFLIHAEMVHCLKYMLKKWKCSISLIITWLTEQSISAPMFMDKCVSER